MRHSKHRTEYDHQTSGEEHGELSKNDHHHHRRRHKKHKHKGEEIDYQRSKNSDEQTPLRSEVIEIPDSSPEHGSQNCSSYYDDHDRKLESHRSRHHRKEERRHGKRRKKSRSHSRGRDNEVDSSKSRCKKSRNDEFKTKRYASGSEGSVESGSENRRKKSGESNANDDRNFERGRYREMKTKSEVERKGRSQFEDQDEGSRRIKKGSVDGEDNDGNEHGSGHRRENMNQEPSGSRGRGPKKRERKEEEWGGPGNKAPKKAWAEVQKPNFGLSGKLAEDTNTYNGVVIKYSEPPEARMPKRRWRLYPFKGDVPLPPLYIHRQSAYLLGRDRKVVDMPIDHPSCSKQHAALQYRLVSYERADGSTGKQIRLYIIDLESANGTFINNKKIEAKKYVELFEKDVIKFGFSSREYVLLHEHSVDDNPDDT